MPMDTIMLNGKPTNISYTATKVGDTVYDRNGESTFIATINDADDLNWIVQPPLKLKYKRAAMMSVSKKY